MMTYIMQGFGRFWAIFLISPKKRKNVKCYNRYLVTCMVTLILLLLPFSSNSYSYNVSNKINPISTKTTKGKKKVLLLLLLKTNDVVKTAPKKLLFFYYELRYYSFLIF